MSKFLQLYHSRLFWTILAWVVYNILQTYGHYLSPSLSVLVNTIFGGLTTYFHINPSQIYTPAGIVPPASGESITQTQP